MIKYLSLGNFRAFQSRVNIRVRPITLLIGKNSAGKSSLIKFLLMLKQTLESESDSFFVTDGKHVQLGTWTDLRHSNTRLASSRDDFLRFRVDLVTRDTPSMDIQELWRVVSRERVFTTEGDRIRLNVELAKRPVSREQKRARFKMDGRIHYGRNFKYGAHDVLGNELFDDGSTGELLFRKRAENNLNRNGFLKFARQTDSLNELLEWVMAERFLEPLRQEFLSFRHLSPIREESQLAVQTGSPPPNDVGHRGEFAVPHLARFFADSNHHHQLEFVAEYARRVAGVRQMLFKSKLTTLLTHIKGRNPDTDATCNLSDFGFGVSQCLPIFVQGAMHQKGQLLVVEQPEAQLHASAQLELGSFFAELWNQRGVPTVIETHSANLLLRLRKLVAQGKLAPNDVSVAFFTIGKGSRPRDQGLDEILEEFGDERPGRFPAVVVKNLAINADGSLEKGLPMEFFGRDVIEAMEIGAEQSH